MLVCGFAAYRVGLRCVGMDAETHTKRQPLDPDLQYEPNRLHACNDTCRNNSIAIATPLAP